MGIMVYSLYWVMQGFVHQPYGFFIAALNQRAPVAERAGLGATVWLWPGPRPEIVQRPGQGSGPGDSRTRPMYYIRILGQRTGSLSLSLYIYLINNRCMYVYTKQESERHMDP